MQNRIWIDKTQPVEEMLETSRAVCLCGMPGMGKKTMVRMLLDRHPEATPCVCSLDQQTEPRPGGGTVWYLVRNLSGEKISGLADKLRGLFSRMAGEDRVFLTTDGEIPEELLEFVWNGSLSLVYPDSFWFTKAETFQYLKACRSSLDKEKTYRFTRGWAGFLALLVRIQRQMPVDWSPEELYSRYEIRQFVRERILGRLPEEEKQLLCRRAFYPRLDRDLEQLLWGEWGQPEEERLFMRGLMLYQPGKASWYVHPAVRRELAVRAERRECLKAVEWYEARGMLREAVECCQNLGDPELFRSVLARNYSRAAWLPFTYTRILRGASETVPEFFYLKWMELYFRQDYKNLEASTALAERQARQGGERIWREIFLNITYLQPGISLKTWMGYLEKYAQPGEDLRLYEVLGESVSFLSGLRDLTELFACGTEEKNRYEKLWKDRLDPPARMAYRLAELEYAFLTDRLRNQEGEFRSAMDEILEESPWQLRMGKLYFLFLSAENGQMESRERTLCEQLWMSLMKEENEVCRYNGMALYYLTESRWGRREDIVRWVKDTGGDIANKYGKTRMHLAAQVKVQIYLGNFSQAGRLLDDLLPYLEKHGIRRFRAEALFQKAICERELGREAEAVRWMTESLQEAEPCRYVRIYTGYGKKGREMLEAYRAIVERSDARITHGKRPYKYGNVRNMPYWDWIDYVIRKARKNERGSGAGQSIRSEEFHPEKLTVTEQMVLQ